MKTIITKPTKNNYKKITRVSQNSPRRRKNKKTNLPKMKICEKCERKIGNIKYEREKEIYDKEYIYIIITIKEKAC